jgi:hypothetical protein
MANYLEFSDEELVRIGRESLRALRFEKAYEVFAVYADRARVEGRPIPAGILANYALTVGHCKSLKEGLALCQAALKADRHAPEVYYCLAQLYVLANARKQAWEAVRHGLSYGPTHADLRRLEKEMGKRSKPVVPFLHRDNPINVRLGRSLRRGKPSASLAGRSAPSAHR